jgi:hypothetical protein
MVPGRLGRSGTINEWPNWSLALPKTIEEMEGLDLPKRIARALSRAPSDG